jgi:hypothetical protein
MLSDEIHGGETVFVLSPALGGGSDSLCGDLLDQYPAHETAVLFVSLTDSPSDQGEFIRDSLGEHPAEASLVYTGGLPGGQEPTVPDSTAVRGVENPGNLTQFGVQVTEALDALRSGPEQVVVCFRSLSALLQYAAPNQVFQFMQVLIDHFKQADAIAHVHMNSDAHDSQTIATFTQLFDVVIDIDEDGTPQIVS